MYGTHPFDWSNKQAGNWGNAFANYAGTYAIALTEFGEYDCNTHYISQLVPYANAHNLSWLSWNWGVGSCAAPNILQGYTGTPTSYGAYLKQQSLAIYQAA
jgi:hypothetical protein